IPDTARCVVVPLSDPPAELDAIDTVMAPVNVLSALPRESLARTSTGGEMTWPTIAEFGWTKKPRTGAVLAPLLPPPPVAIPIKPEPVPQPVITNVIRLRTMVE